MPQSRRPYEPIAGDASVHPTATNTLHRAHTHTPSISCDISHSSKPPRATCNHRSNHRTVPPFRHRPTTARGHTAAPNAAKLLLHHRRIITNTAQSHRAATVAPSIAATSTPVHSGELGQGARPCTPAGEQVLLCPCGTLLLLPRYLIACYLAWFAVLVFFSDEGHRRLCEADRSLSSAGERPSYPHCILGSSSSSLGPP